MPKLSKPLRNLEFLLLALIAIAVLLRIVYVGEREFWYDEVLSLLLSTGQKGAYRTPGDVPVDLSSYSSVLTLPPETSWSNFLGTLEKLLKGLVAEPHPPLFYLGQHFWLRLFGNSEAALRSLGVLFSVGAIGGAYGLGNRVLGHRGGLLLAALLGVNPFFLFHSLNVRMYTPLVFWTVVSAWLLLELIHLNRTVTSRRSLHRFGLWVLLIGSVTAGLMTFYYFAVWLVALGAVVLLLDRKRWWQYALALSTGAVITTPWVWWGTRQQLRNADLNRFATSNNWLETVATHTAGVVQTLGIHLAVGDWVSTLPPAVVIGSGVLVILGLLGCSVSLWHRGRQAFGIAFLLGILPLLLMLAVDVVSGKFTVGFGWGRSVIFILPGCLLLIAAWAECSQQQWQKATAAILLVLYLSVSVADFSGRSRWVFHRLANIIEQQPATPTLVAINSKAWGHVLRLVYYLPTNAPVSLLAQDSASLASGLEKTLSGSSYPRLIWLDSQRPLWAAPQTEAQAAEDRQNVQQVLNSRYQLEKIQPLSGTMELDEFTAYIYSLSASS
ncbi:MAG: glycosyltransferase family 39 protein [Cyanophyceae cyanobacterium]